jgi:hypothetical protein
MIVDIYSGQIKRCIVVIMFSKVERRMHEFASSPSPFPPFQVDRAAGSGSIRKSNKRGKTREAVVVAVGPIQAKEVPLLAFVAVSAALNFGQGTPPPFRHVAFAL